MFRLTPGDILPGQTLLQIATPRRWSEEEGPMPPAGRGSAQRGRLGGELFADRLSRTRCSCCRCLSAGEGVGQPCGIRGRLATGYKSLCPGGQLQMSRSAASLNRAGWGPAAGLPIPSVTGPSPRIRKRSSFADQCCDWLPAKRKSLQTGHWTCQTRAIRAPPRAARDSRC